MEDGVRHKRSNATRATVPRRKHGVRYRRAAPLMGASERPADPLVVTSRGSILKYPDVRARNAFRLETLDRFRRRGIEQVKVLRQPRGQPGPKHIAYAPDQRNRNDERGFGHSTEATAAEARRLIAGRMPDGANTCE